MGLVPVLRYSWYCVKRVSSAKTNRTGSFLPCNQMSIDKRCPNCGSVCQARITRVDGARGCHEWECGGCKGRWVVKDDQPGETFVCWPQDVTDAFDCDVPALDLSCA